MYIDDAIMRPYLDLAIALLNPRERWPAHVTIAGPFPNRIEVPRSLEFSQEVYLLGRGRFDSDTRHTVFLNVGSKNMAAHVEKPDYPNAIPHLSLYNGRDAEIADLLFEGLGRLNSYGVFHAKRLEVVESKQQYSFNLKQQVNTDILPATRGKALDQLRRLSKGHRVALALDAVRWGLRRPFSLIRALESH
jgi:hypothetical protein